MCATQKSEMHTHINDTIHVIVKQSIFGIPNKFFNDVSVPKFSKTCFFNRFFVIESQVDKIALVGTICHIAMG